MNRPGPEREWLPDLMRRAATREYWRIVCAQDETWVDTLAGATTLIDEN